MALQIMKPGTGGPRPERILEYGRAGVGKTRFGLSLTPRFGDIIYYAADENSEDLASIDPSKRSRITVLKPRGDDPIQNFTEFCMHNWQADFPNAKTLVVDTYSKVAEDAIQYSANTGAVTAEKHFQIGDVKKGGQIIPNRGDYLAIESISKGFLSLLFEYQRDMNIIFIMHEDLKVDEKAGTAFGGPSHPGRRMQDIIPATFNTVIRLTRETILVPGKSVPDTVVVANTANTGAYIAKIRENDETQGNPLPKVILGKNPVNFWEQYDALFYTPFLPASA